MSIQSGQGKPFGGMMSQGEGQEGGLGVGQGFEVVEDAVVSEPVAVDALEALTALRGVIAHMLSQLTRGRGSVTQIAEGMGIERTLAWKLSRIGSAPDPYAVVQHLPGDRAMGRVWEMALQRGVSHELVGQGREALSRFRKLEAHTDDRASLSLLVGGQAMRGRQELDSAQRRAAYRASSYLLGASAHVMYDATFVARSSKHAGFLDLVTLRGLLGLSRMRADIPWPIARQLTSVVHDGQVAQIGEALLPDSPAENHTCGSTDVDAHAAIDGAPARAAGFGRVPIMRRFSSANLPGLIREPSLDGYERFSLPSCGLGKHGEVDVMIGERYRAVARCVAQPGEPNHAVAVYVRTPCRHAVIEQFVHDDAIPSTRLQRHSQQSSGRSSAAPYADLEMTVEAGSLQFGEPSLADIQYGRGLRVPLFERVENLGKASLAAPPRHVPRHGELSVLGASSLGFDLSEFTLFRVTLEYPPQPTVIVLKTPLPRELA